MARRRHPRSDRRSRSPQRPAVARHRRPAASRSRRIRRQRRTARRRAPAAARFAQQPGARTRNDRDAVDRVVDRNPPSSPMRSASSCRGSKARRCCSRISPGSPSAKAASKPCRAPSCKLPRTCGTRCRRPIRWQIRAALETAIARSGVFLESNLAAHRGPPDPRFGFDLKTLMLALNRALQTQGAKPSSALTTTRRPRACSDGARAADCPARQHRPRWPCSTSPTQQLNELARQADGTLARLTTVQISNSAPDPAVQSMLIDLPVRHEDRAAVLRLKIERDGSRRREGDGAESWTVEAAVDLGAIGALHAKVTLVGKRIGVQLRAESPAIVAALSQRVGRARSDACGIGTRCRPRSVPARHAGGRSGCARCALAGCARMNERNRPPLAVALHYSGSGAPRVVAKGGGAGRRAHPRDGPRSQRTAATGFGVGRCAVANRSGERNPARAVCRGRARARVRLVGRGKE